MRAEAGRFRRVSGRGPLPQDGRSNEEPIDDA
jgi:hypothetical protein